jgi:hypothetical protein
VSSLILEVHGTFLILTGAGLNFELALREFSALVWGEFIELWETNKFCKDLFLGGGGLFQIRKMIAKNLEKVFKLWKPQTKWNKNL